MDEHPMKNENKDSLTSSDNDDSDESSQPSPNGDTFSSRDRNDVNLETKSDKDNKRFSNVKKISQFWKSVRNKTPIVFQELPKIHMNRTKEVTLNSECSHSFEAAVLNSRHTFIESKDPTSDALSLNPDVDQPAEAHWNGIKFCKSSHAVKLQSFVIEQNFQPSIGTVHTQVDYVHWLVPDLLQITNCIYYWGVMDRFEAEKMLENRAEGTFLLRDSAQEEFLFSVSFRRYSRSLHARIEQWDHKFSFDSHDSSVFASRSVCGLIEHYKDPSCCMFFEPMLTIPLSRNKPFALQHLCRATICNIITYDGISVLPIPKSLKQYLQYYHYKQKVRVRQF